MLSFFPRGVLDEILNLIESVSEEFPSYSFKLINVYNMVMLADLCSCTQKRRKLNIFFHQTIDFVALFLTVYKYNVLFEKYNANTSLLKSTLMTQI